MALHLADKGVDIVITYRTQKDEAKEVVSKITGRGGKAVALQLDVTQFSAYPAFATTLKDALQDTWMRSDFDFLVNNAGTGLHATVAETTPQQFDEMVNIHLKAPFFLTQTLLPLMKDGGRILNISSGLTRFSYPGFAAYAMMKGGVEVMTRYLAKELGERRIAVNTLAPGAIETDFGGGMVRDNLQMNAAIASQTALGRVGQPEDIGGAVTMLLAPESVWLNGQRVEASGGIYL
jgi:NAD(P)-dependent dehydrogenase (short-subunit alcohol dehydrogenase family)